MLVKNLDKAKTNKVVFSKGSTANIRKIPDTSSAILLEIKTGSPGGRTTGWYIEASGYKWYQVAFYKVTEGEKYGYIREDVVKFGEPAESVEAQNNVERLVKAMITSDQIVFGRVLVMCDQIGRLKASGKNVSKLEEIFKKIITRLSARQYFLKNSGIAEFKYGYKKGFGGLVDKFKNYLNTEYGGYVSALPVIAVAVVLLSIGAGLAIGAYYIFKPVYDESQTDLVVSKELQDLLDKADPGVAEEIKADLELQIDNAYNQGKKDQKFGDLWDIVKNVGLLVGGFFLLDRVILPAFNKNRKNG